MDGGRPLGRVWRVEFACADAEGIPVPLGVILAGGAAHQQRWATVIRLDARLGWVLSGGRPLAEASAAGWRGDHGAAVPP